MIKGLSQLNHVMQVGGDKIFIIDFYINFALLIKQLTVFMSHWIVHLTDLDSFKNKTTKIYNSFNINGSVFPTSPWVSVTFAVKKRFYSIHLFHKLKSEMAFEPIFAISWSQTWVLFTRSVHHQICKTFWQLLRLTLPN